MHPALRVSPALLLLTCVACGASADNERRAGGSRVMLSDEITEDGLVVRRVDIDQDGQADVFEYFRASDSQGNEVTDYDQLARRDYADLDIVRKEMDVNLDGGIDLQREYGPGARLLREAFDVDFDGVFDTVNLYEEGTLSQRLSDTDGDGFSETVNYYREGQIHRVETDTNANGQTDNWAYFEGERLVRIGIDVNGDGVIDQRIRSEEIAADGPRPEVARRVVREIRPISRPEDALGPPPAPGSSSPETAPDTTDEPTTPETAPATEEVAPEEAPEVIDAAEPTEDVTTDGEDAGEGVAPAEDGAEDGADAETAE